MFSDDDIIHTYSRAEAIKDGVLIDVTETARDAGFKVPVALTSAAWADCVAWDETNEKDKRHATGHDENGRLWDVLTATRYAVRRARGDAAPIILLRVPPHGAEIEPQFTALKSIIGPGDEAETVITICLPHED